jgi:hypothetical protein
MGDKFLIETGQVESNKQNNEINLKSLLLEYWNPVLLSKLVIGETPDVYAISLKSSLMFEQYMIFWEVLG